MDLTVVAYATLALSLFVSAVKMGGWILNADPRAMINSGRWALLALVVLALGVLGWLLATGRWTSAMMLAAFMLPVFVQAAPRWRVLELHPATSSMWRRTAPGLQWAIRSRQQRLVPRWLKGAATMTHRVRSGRSRRTSATSRRPPVWPG